MEILIAIQTMIIIVLVVKVILLRTALKNVCEESRRHHGEAIAMTKYLPIDPVLGQQDTINTHEGHSQNLYQGYSVPPGGNEYTTLKYLLKKDYPRFDEYERYVARESKNYCSAIFMDNFSKPHYEQWIKDNPTSPYSN